MRPDAWERWCSGLAVLFVVALLAGCRSAAKRPTAPPALVNHAGLFVGSPLSGPTADATPQVSPSVVSQVRVRWFALQDVPAGELAPIDARSRLTLSPRSRSALLPSGQLTRAVRFDAGAGATAFAEALESGRLGEWVGLAREERLIVPGATLTFTTSPAGGSPDEGERVSLQISPTTPGTATTQATEAMVAVLVVARPPQGDGASNPVPLVQEAAVVDAVPATDGSTFAVALPFASGGTPWSAIAAIVDVRTTSIDPAGVTRLEADLRQASADVQASRAAVGDATPLEAALAALRQPDAARPALLLLAGRSNARIAGDMVLVADDDQLARFAAATLDFTAKKDAGAAPSTAVATTTTSTPPPADLQWFLDRYAVQTMCELAEQNVLSPELQSALALHAGDVARRPDAILELLRQANGSDALAQRLIAENQIALEDSSPAARVRAYDWLDAQGKAPPNYDPLADARSRRAAIDATVNAQGARP